MIGEEIVGGGYDGSPEVLKKIVRTLLRRMPFTRVAQRDRWVREVYYQFGQDERRRMFMSIARFCHINRPIEGYYFEFGSHGAHTIRLAFEIFHHLFDWTYVAFDSFEGLPEISTIDQQQIWQKGKLKTSEDDFIRVVTRHGMPKEKLITINGFYKDSLNGETRSKLLPQKAAVVYVDCDLYESTVPVLRFCKDFLQRGTILVFDDWNCFHGDPARGERLAFGEFRRDNPTLIFEDFVVTNEAKAFIFLGERESA